MVVREVVFSEGIAGASSQYATFDPKHAFVPAGAPWITDNKHPQYLWYDFQNPGHLYCPTKISFLPEQSEGLATAPNRFPKIFQFIGTNDNTCNEDSHWEVLCEAEYQELVSSQQESRGCEVKEQSRNFRCFGIKVLENHGDKYTALDNVNIWVAE